MTLTELNTGVALEVVALGPASSTRAAFCLHPWSRLGGCMYDRTVQTVVEHLQARNDFTVVYYNSRGVGESTGWPSLTGKSEGGDLQALVERFLDGHPRVDSVTFVGYSHGALIATLHPVLPPHIRTSFVLLSYPLGPRALLTLFHSATYSSALTSLLRDAHTRLLVVHGDRDEFTSRSRYESWTESLKTTDGAKAQLTVVTVANAGHFWHTEASRAVLRATLDGWLG